MSAYGYFYINPTTLSDHSVAFDVKFVSVDPATGSEFATTHIHDAVDLADAIRRCDLLNAALSESPRRKA